jgi:hypothetical protein
MAAEQKAHAEDTKTVAPSAREVDDTLWEDAALRAADYDNIDGRLPVEPEHVANQMAKQLPKPPAAVASEDQVLREELLTNDSLGG